VLISTDLTFDQHVTSVSGQCFYQLRQLRSVRQSLDTESTTTHPCLCLEPRGLLRQSAHRVTEFSSGSLVQSAGMPYRTI